MLDCKARRFRNNRGKQNLKRALQLWMSFRFSREDRSIALMAETVIDLRLRQAVRHFVSSGLEPEKEVAVFEQLIRRTHGGGGCPELR
jgi:hypothetical protein